MITVEAGNLPRVMQCNGSLLMEADLVFAERDNTIREEGNAAHWLASTVFNSAQTALEYVDRKAPNGIYITPEMADHVQEYVNAIGLGADMEWSYSIGGENWRVNGRADAMGWECHPNDQYEQPYWIHVRDFKYGYSIVEPEKNWTLISHAVGYCIHLRAAPAFITFYIHQPRAAHYLGRVRSVTLTYQELLDAYQTLAATLANPSNMLQTGPQCYKCHSFLSCQARQDAELNAIEVSRVAYNADISNSDLQERMLEIHRADELLKQSKKAYEELMTHRIKIGQPFDKFSLETDLANRSWKEGTTPEFLNAITGKNLAKQELITPRQAELLGVPENVVAAFTERHQKGVKLVRMDASKKARKMFGDKKS